ncbi:MAG: division/outer membrane stress-associated lipid-binding lipoprotein [Pasteurellaceae bacterium]|nr:division/outer membrane stress-associated lipid-binding lipoprotein [Pasteurellaceae bacterium]
MSVSRISKLSAIIASTLLLQGCVAAALFGGATVATNVGTDARTVGTQVDDSKLDLQVASAVNKDEQINQEGRVVAVSYSGRILLLGQVPDESLKETATGLAKGVNGVTEVYNEMTVGKPITFTQKSKDSWITTKVKSQMLTNDSVKSTDVKVVTENAVVYLLGNLTTSQADAAAEVARNVAGVEKVVKVINYIN